MKHHGTLTNLSLKSALLVGVAASVLLMTSFDPVLAGNGGGGGGGGGGGAESSSSDAGGGGGGGGGSDNGQGGGGRADTGQDDGGASAGQGSGGTVYKAVPKVKKAPAAPKAPRVTVTEEDDGKPAWAGTKGGNPDQGVDPSSGGGRPDDKGGRPDDVGGGDEDSDRPDWAGVPGGSAGHGEPPNAGGGGDLYGDLYVILRDDQGMPILNEDGYVQPIAADGSLIPLDDEGAPIDEALVQEVEIGRLNVSRAPNDVFAGRSDEVVSLLNSADSVSFDPAGRLVITVDGVDSTIDSPLENLAIYISLMDTGTIEGVDNPALEGLFLVDGIKDDQDLEAAAAFLAAATDKSGELTLDEIAYINLILDIETEKLEGSTVSYSDVDYTTFTYDREEAYGDVTTTVLVQLSDGTWVEQEVNVYEAVFGSEDDDAPDGTMEAFTQAADDSRAVIEFVHEFAVPES